MEKVKIIDRIMGSGKTYDEIEKLKRRNGKQLYVTPFLDEIERVKSQVPNICDPKVSTFYNYETDEIETTYKRDNLLNLANKRGNIITTHSLFTGLHRSDYSYFKGYDLILDEVLTPIDVIAMKSDDIDIAFSQGLLVENELTGEVTFTGDEYKGNLYAKLRKYCATSNVIYVNGRLLVWAFPPEIFSEFKSITVLTYLFEGSLLRNYFKYYNIPYEIVKNLTEDVALKTRIREQLNIYKGKYNNIGNHPSAFCVRWLSNRTISDFKKIKSTTANVLARKFGTNSKETAFTCFKKYESKLKGKGYSKGYISVNAKATNNYSHKKTMIYLANRFLNPNMVDFFRSRSIVIDQDQWALSELLQWLWRGCIRKGEPMNVYIPSKRMRTLLLDWLESNEDSKKIQNAA